MDSSEAVHTHLPERCAGHNRWWPFETVAFLGCKDEDVLHAFAKQVGLSRTHYIGVGQQYFLTPNEYVLARCEGAELISFEEFVDLYGGVDVILERHSIFPEPGKIGVDPSVGGRDEASFQLAEDGSTYTVPLVYLERVVKGELGITEIPGWEIIVPQIIKDWLQNSMKKEVVK